MVGRATRGSPTPSPRRPSQVGRGPPGSAPEWRPSGRLAAWIDCAHRSTASPTKRSRTRAPRCGAPARLGGSSWPCIDIRRNWDGRSQEVIILSVGFGNYCDQSASSFEAR